MFQIIERPLRNTGLSSSAQFTTPFVSHVWKALLPENDCQLTTLRRQKNVGSHQRFQDFIISLEGRKYNRLRNTNSVK